MDSDETKRILERALRREQEIGKENFFVSSDIRHIDDCSTAVADQKDKIVEEETNVDVEPKKPKRTSLYPCEELEELKKDAIDEAQANEMEVTADTLSLQAERVEKVSPKRVQRRERFAMLSAQIANFECEVKPQRSKESYTKGPSPRLSVGETRPSALFVPNSSYHAAAGVTKSPPKKASLTALLEADLLKHSRSSLHETVVHSDTSEESHPKVEKSYSGPCEGGTSEKHLRFASPICEVRNAPRSVEERSSITTATISESSNEISTDDDKTFDSPLESTNIQGSPRECTVVRSNSHEFGIQNFFKRKMSNTLSPGSSSLDKKFETPSPIPKAVSESAIHTLSTTYTVTPSVEIPVVREEPKKSFGTRGDIVDEMVAAADRATKGLRDIPQSHSGRAKEMAHKFEEKIKNEGNINIPKPAIKPVNVIKAVTPTPTPRQTAPTQTINIHWRTSTPCGHPVKVDTSSTSVKDLRNRWEVSSATGTPLHPDQNEHELFEAALRMSRSACRVTPGRIRPRSCVETDSTGTAKEDSKQSPRPLSTGSSVYNTATEESKEQTEETEPIEEEESEDEISSAATANGKNEADESKRNEHTTDQLIDEAFEFIDENSESNAPKRSSSFLNSILNTPEVKMSISYDLPRTPEGEQASDEHMPMVHSVSFYRKRKQQWKPSGETVVLGQFKPTPPRDSAACGEISSPNNGISEGERFATEKSRLEKAICVQQEQIAQASRALSLCRSTHEFRGSREEVAAQRALLIATESRRALIFVLDKLLQRHSNGGKMKNIEGPRGTVTIEDITIKLMRDFVNGNINYQNDQMVFYFMVLIRNGEKVKYTAMLTSDHGLKSGNIQFPNLIKFDSLSHDFSCTLEVYALRTRREVIGHEEKYHIKGSTLKKTQKSPLFSPGFSSPGGPSAVIDPSFQKIGHLNINFASCSKTTFQLSDPMSPLDGLIQMRLKCFAEETGTVGMNGFMSLYREDTKGVASWTRFWCVLSDGNLNFWRFPEDEGNKAPVVYLELRACVHNQITPIPVESCPYPHSMNIDVWVPNEKGKRDKLRQFFAYSEFQFSKFIRVTMAADNKDEMHAWMDAINRSLYNMTLWNPKMQ